LLGAGAVVFTRDASIGLAAITTRPMAVSQHLIAWCPGADLDTLYLLRSINAMAPSLEAFTFGATIKTIGMADVKKLAIPLPPREEQIKIAQHIESKLKEFSDLLDQVQTSIEVMQERRSALISAAVTGKIDVRGFAASQQ
jgi:type I restriction enzyme, S subunit